MSVPKNQVAVQDQTLKVDCFVDAHPKGKISWLFGGKVLTTTDGFKFEMDPKSGKYSMIIPKVNGAVHLGTYTVKAANVVGSIEENFDMSIMGNSFF